MAFYFYYKLDWQVIFFYSYHYLINTILYMSKSIFSADGDLFSDKQQEKIINNNVKNSEDDLSDYQKTIEHLFGFYECVNYISNQLYHAANIKN